MSDRGRTIFNFGPDERFSRELFSLACIQKTELLWRKPSNVREHVADI